MKIRKLAERVDGLVNVPVDEYLTSRVCPSVGCRGRTMGGKLTGEKRTVSTKRGERTYSVRSHKVRVCNHCRTHWDRDNAASINMLSVAISILKGEERPAHLARDGPNAKVRSAVPASPKGAGTKRRTIAVNLKRSRERGGVVGSGENSPRAAKRMWKLFLVHRQPLTTERVGGRKRQIDGSPVGGAVKAKKQKLCVQRPLARNRALSSNLC